jgi:predicted Holliday junction resolvase-like endonuclease
MYGDYPLAARKRMAKRTAQVVSLTGDIQERISILRKDQTRKPQQITLGTESSNFGKGIEQIAPAFSTFPYSPAECRIVLMPVDYIMFEGLSNYGRIEAIRFVELKTGSGRLLKRQKQIRDCIKQGTSLTR